MLTSANAVEVLNSYMHVGATYYVIDWKVFCLSGRTKEAVLSARLLSKNIPGEAANAALLAKDIIRQSIKRSGFFLRRQTKR